MGVEQADYTALAALGYTALAALFGDEAARFLQDKQGAKGPLMVGVFSGQGRLNLGEFDGFVTADTARECFFNVIRSQLGLVGDPVWIGAIKDVYGHPGTGWPADNRSFGASKKSGCAAVVASLAALVILLWGTWELSALFANP